MQALALLILFNLSSLAPATIPNPTATQMAEIPQEGPDSEAAWLYIGEHVEFLQS